MQTYLDNPTSFLRSCTNRPVLLLTHYNPDGDALGSMAAMGYVLATLNCDIRLFLPTGVPTALSWIPLPWAKASSVAELAPWVPERIIVLDCGDAGRTGPEMQAYFTQATLPSPEWAQAESLCIDHHTGTRPFATQCWIDPTKAATGEMVALLAENLGITLSGDLGKAVYLALVSDTGSFSFSNTSPDTLRMAARILAAGLDLPGFNQEYENTWTLNRMHLWGNLMQSITLHSAGKIALCLVPDGLLASYGTDKDDLEGLASWLRRIRGVDIALFVRGDGPNRSKISLRSMGGGVNVQVVAAAFGGGGHKAAAGAELPYPPETTAQMVLAKLAETLP